MGPPGLPGLPVPPVHARIGDDADWVVGWWAAHLGTLETRDDRDSLIACVYQGLEMLEREVRRTSRPASAQYRFHFGTLRLHMCL